METEANVPMSTEKRVLLEGLVEIGLSELKAAGTDRASTETEILVFRMDLFQVLLKLLRSDSMDPDSRRVITSKLVAAVTFCVQSRTTVHYHFNNDTQISSQQRDGVYAAFVLLKVNKYFG